MVREGIVLSDSAYGIKGVLSPNLMPKMVSTKFRAW